ncbi:class I SAM-dependent methyltransferase [Accumulibacter sp.]|uniref:class I SAM-dependent methyltransferase n=1 Tax=Accumulibacter sp. TaxID=2053492 RepID=UPI0025BBA881|nr:class I SAM-dependent methyltransferase [Accumulibacter sp.]
MPTEILLADIYDAWMPRGSREELRGDLNLDDYRYLANEVQFLIQHFRLHPKQISVLDFGFGWAEWARMAMAYGCDVSGSELSRDRIEYAESIGLNVLAVDQLPANHFHFINTEQVFEHLVDPNHLIAHLATRIRVGGILKISVPDSSRSLRKLASNPDFSSLSRDEIMPIAPLEHINSFTHKSLVALAHTAGLKRLRPSLYKLYNGSSGWLEVSGAIKLIGRHLYRHIFPKSTFAYFVRTLRKEGESGVKTNA